MMYSTMSKSVEMGQREQPLDERMRLEKVAQDKANALAEAERRKLEAKAQATEAAKAEAEQETITFEQFCYQVKEHPMFVTNAIGSIGHFHSVRPAGGVNSRRMPKNYSLTGARIRMESQQKAWLEFKSEYESEKQIATET